MERQLSHLETVRILCSVTDRFSYRLVQTEVCNTSGTSYHKALCSTRMFPHPFRLHAHWHRRVAFLFYAHTPIRYCTSAYTHNAQPPIRIFARAYIQICTCIYTEMHIALYAFPGGLIQCYFIQDGSMIYSFIEK